MQTNRVRIRSFILRSAGRQFAALSITALAIALFAGYHRARGQETTDAYQFSRDAQQGKAIAPVTLNLMGKNPELVYIGSYLVNAKLQCNLCHSCPSFTTNPYTVGGPALGPPPNPGPINSANYLSGGVPFPGFVPFSGSLLSAPNITPNSSGLPGGLTYDDFKTAMTSGSVTTKPGHILQVMPWPLFRNLYENDLVAIYQYLSAIPPAQRGSSCSGPGQGQGGNSQGGNGNSQ